MKQYKTLLFAPCYLDEGERLERNLKWLRYYKPLKEKLGYDEILLVDNGSSQSKLHTLIDENIQDLSIKHFPVHLPRLTQHAYSYWYFAFGEAAKYAIDNGFDKIIHIDTDVYLFTDKICEFVKNTNHGWTSMWCEMHKYPESTFQIIGADYLLAMKNFMTRDFLAFYPYDLAETRIPWTHIEKGFKGDRYGEKMLQQADDMHWYGQCPVNIFMTFKGKL